ncbi:sensor histidine kinase [Tissierella pigra]|uniref:histidine kinase n=1 Tax=Tissierella pigra TaxID=2607614 RepID=A0A6N7XMH5_9FIRM|nr:sensor histidine kinase [Tissierella pigra]MBU5428136.1 sensor histidine kinase [Tissierella pigra]MSU01992.1 sensor histidine kinase [Tissierella pigra]
MKSKNIRLKIIYIIFVTLIPLSILKFIDIQKQFNESIENQIEVNSDIAEMLSNVFVNFLERIWDNQYTIGISITTHTNWSNASIKEYLNKIKYRDNNLDMQYYWATDEGIITTDLYSDNLEIDIRDTTYFNEILSGKEKAVGNLQHSIISKELIIPIARGIRVDGKLKGIVINTLNVNDMEDIIPLNKPDDKSTYGIIDKEGTYVYCSIKNDMSLEERKIALDSPSIMALKGQIVRTSARYSNIEGKDKLEVNFPLDEIGWSAFAVTSIEELLIDNRQTFTKDIFVLVFFYFISFIIAMFVSNGLIRSIDKLKDTAYKVIKGDLTIRTEIENDDYLGDVGQAFDSMIDTVSEKVKEVEEYNELKSQFLATMSHELKTPLNIILGCVQLLENCDIEDEEFESYFNKYIYMQKQNSYRLLRLINNIIDINKLETNHFHFRPMNNDIVKVVEDITMSIVEYTKLKNINIIFDTDIEEKIIAFDSDMMERIILNLLSNAIKFTEAGGKIEVNIKNTEEVVMISVRDSGVGIPADKLHMIFDRFSQVDSPLNKRAEGSGIGLHLVKALVELHEGYISVESELGQWTEFIIGLPNKVLDEFYDIEDSNNPVNAEKIRVEFSDIYV